jgi:hypothetical protein
MPDAQVVTELRRLEESLWQEETRFDRDYMDSLLSNGFIEFGRSGRIWTREATLTTPKRKIGARLPLPKFGVRMISDEVALVTYRSEGLEDDVGVGNRASIWRKTSDGWKLEFHQGTATRR